MPHKQLDSYSQTSTKKAHRIKLHARERKALQLKLQLMFLKDWPYFQRLGIASVKSSRVCSKSQIRVLGNSEVVLMADKNPSGRAEFTDTFLFSRGMPPGEAKLPRFRRPNETKLT